MADAAPMATMTQGKKASLSALPVQPVSQASTHPARAAHRRPRGGSLRSAVLTAGFAGLFVSGLYLWLRPSAVPVIVAHAAGGIVVTMLLVPWLLRHVPRMICHAQRPAFTWTSWTLLALWAALILSGLVMTAPAALWLVGLVWFPAREWIEGLSLVHFWSSWAAMAGLALHLAMRHWQVPAGGGR